MTTITRVVSSAPVAIERVCVAGMFKDADPALKEALLEHGTREDGGFIIISSVVAEHLTESEINDLFMMETMGLQHYKYYGTIPILALDSLFLGYNKEQLQKYWNSVADSNISKKTLIKLSALLSASIKASPLFNKIFDASVIKQAEKGYKLTQEQFDFMFEMHLNESLTCIDIAYLSDNVVRPGEEFNVVLNTDGVVQNKVTGVIVDYVGYSATAEGETHNTDYFTAIVLLNGKPKLIRVANKCGNEFTFNYFVDDVDEEDLAELELTIGVKKAIGLA